MNEDGGDIGAFMAGFVIGGLVGAAAALLMAPQSGAITRAQIAAKGEELRLAGEEQIQHYSEAAGTTFTDVQHRMKETGEQVQERARIVLDEGKSKLAPAKEKSKEQVQEAADEIAESTDTEEDETGDTDA